MSTSPIVTMAKHSLTWSTFLAVFIIVAGVLAIIVPPAAGIAATILIGWLLVFSAVTHFIFAWHTRSAGGLTWGILLGIVYMVAGIYLLVHPIPGLAALTLVLAAYLTAEAVIEFVLAWRLRPLGGSGWLIFDGAVTLVLAILIWTTWPSSSEWAIGTLLGISMIFSGSSRLALVTAARRAVTKLA
jgi:uncharacterized membrane protein HdeD (DUF308 family)